MSRQNNSQEKKAILKQKIDAFFDDIKVLNSQDFRIKLETLTQSLSLRQIEIPNEFEWDANDIHRCIYHIYQSIHLYPNVKKLREDYDEIEKCCDLDQSKVSKIKKQFLKRYPFKSVKKDFLIAKAAIEFYKTFLDVVDHGYIGLNRLRVLYEQYMERQKYCFHLNFLQFSWDEIKDRYEYRNTTTFKRSVNGTDFKMIACQAGDFCRLDIEWDVRFNHDASQKWVKTDPFWISETPVTIALWCEVMSPYLRKNRYRFFNHDQKNTHALHPNHPVTLVNFYNAIVFCNRLSQLEGFSLYYNIKSIKKHTNEIEDDEYDQLYIDVEIDREDGFAAVYPKISSYQITINEKSNGYHLPSEVQWEFAAKSCNPKAYDASQSQLPEALQYMGHYDQQIKAVKSTKPNQIGLYGFGDLFEMCPNHYPMLELDMNENQKIKHIVKGSLSKEKFHASSRGFYEPFYGEYLLGFRIVRSET